MLKVGDLVMVVEDNAEAADVKEGDVGVINHIVNPESDDPSYYVEICDDDGYSTEWAFGHYSITPIEIKEK